MLKQFFSQMGKNTDKRAEEAEAATEAAENQEQEEQIQDPEENTESTDNQEGEEQEQEDNETATLDPVIRLETELTAAKDKQLRLLAEFENYKRRTAKERIELRKTAAEEVMVDLLSVLDDFDRALAAIGDKPEATIDRDGFQLIANKFRSTLEQKGLSAMDSANKDFDPEWHEAITEIPAPTEEMKGKVVDVIEKGYVLGEKIIRYAKVVVGK